MFHFVTSGATRFGNISDSSSESDNEPIGLNPGKISTLYSEDCLNDINPVEHIHSKKYSSPSINRIAANNGQEYCDLSFLGVARYLLTTMVQLLFLLSIF